MLCIMYYILYYIYIRFIIYIAYMLWTFIMWYITYYIMCVYIKYIVYIAHIHAYYLLRGVKNKDTDKNKMDRVVTLAGIKKTYLY